MYGHAVNEHITKMMGKKKSMNFTRWNFVFVAAVSPDHSDKQSNG